jgi:hypothetical protein
MIPVTFLTSRVEITIGIHMYRYIEHIGIVVKRFLDAVSYSMSDQTRYTRQTIVPTMMNIPANNQYTVQAAGANEK